MIFNDSKSMMSLLQQKKPGIHFAHSVGVAPGTTTMNLGCPGCTPMGGVAAPCPPEETNQTMVDRNATAMTKALLPVAAGGTVAFDPYGSEAELKGAAPFGMSWTKIGIFTALAAVVGGAAAWAHHRK